VIVCVTVYLILLNDNFQLLSFDAFGRLEHAFVTTRVDYFSFVLIEV